MDNKSGLKKRITIVCPVYNEELSLPVFYKRIESALSDCEKNYIFDFLFTNNCSSDNTLHVLRELQKQNERIHILTLSRNFGYQSSVLAGITHATGDAVCIIDADGEDPPEMIPAFIEFFEQGYDIVYGERGGRPEPRWLTGARKLFYRILGLVADFDILLDMAEFSLFSRRVKESIVVSSNTFPFIRSELAYCGFRRRGIPYDRDKRIAGKSNYNLFTMFLFAAGGILTSSTFIFRFAAYLFPMLFVFNIFSLAMISAGASSQWFQSVVIIDLLYLTLFLTLHGLYLGRIYKNSLSRPIFIIDEENSSYALSNQASLERGSLERGMG